MFGFALVLFIAQFSESGMPQWLPARRITNRQASGRDAPPRLCGYAGEDARSAASFSLPRSVGQGVDDPSPTRFSRCEYAPDTRRGGGAYTRPDVGPSDVYRDNRMTSLRALSGTGAARRGLIAKVDTSRGSICGAERNCASQTANTIRGVPRQSSGR
jgi:hypothetical protein